jgi:hypothetical protein
VGQPRANQRSELAFIQQAAFVLDFFTVSIPVSIPSAQNVMVRLVVTVAAISLAWELFSFFSYKK